MKVNYEILKFNDFLELLDSLDILQEHQMEHFEDSYYGDVTPYDNDIENVNQEINESVLNFKLFFDIFSKSHKFAHKTFSKLKTNKNANEFNINELNIELLDIDKYLENKEKLDRMEQLKYGNHEMEPNEYNELISSFDDDIKALINKIQEYEQNIILFFDIITSDFNNCINIHKKMKLNKT
jgi:hypothetical protein